jgi:hypothetical protein
MPRVGWIIAVCLVAGSGLGFWQYDRERRVIEAEDAATHQRDMQFKLDSALAAIRSEDWANARERLYRLEVADPAFEEKRVAELLRAADRELVFGPQLDEVHAHIEKSELKAAHELLERVAQDTAQLKRVAELRAQLQKKIDERMHDARVLAYSTGDPSRMKELLALSEEVLSAQPGQKDALAFRDLAVDALSREHPAFADPPPPQPWRDVQTRFIQGDLEGAKAMAQACAPKFMECRQQAQDLARFEKQYKKSAAATSAQLEALITLSRKISGGPFTELLRSPGRDATDGLMTKAHALWGAGQLAAAVVQARKALALDPDDSRASAFLADAREKARELFLQRSHDRESPDEDIERLKTVLELTDAKDEYHLKAQQRLAQLLK